MNPANIPAPAGLRLTTPARTLIVADIHGCHDELLALVDLAGLTEADRIVAVGDLVDRGTQSWEVVDFFRSRPESRFSVRGNHEWKHLLHADMPVMPNHAGMITRGAMGPERYALTQAYFRTLPLWIELPEALVVHAGVDPATPLENADPRLIMGVASKARPGFDGDSPWWFDDARLELQKPVVFGHHVFAEVARGRRRNVWGINTGAGYGQPLTGLLLPEFRLLSVPTRAPASELPRRWSSAAEWLQLPMLRWPPLFKLLAARRLPEPALSIVEDAVEELETLAQEIAEEGKALRLELGIDAADGAERRAILAPIEASGRFDSPYGRLLLHAVKGHRVIDPLKKSFPTPQQLAHALADGRLKRDG